MYESMLKYSSNSFLPTDDRSVAPSALKEDRLVRTSKRRITTRRLALKPLHVALLIMGLIFLTPSLAADSTRTSKPPTQSETAKAVQSQIDKQTLNAATEKRKNLLADATAAIAETEKALRALEEKKSDAALTDLAEATGKLELIVARDPKLALAPVHMDVVSYDFFASPATVKSTVQTAKKALNAGEIQTARVLVDALASEVQLRTTNIPLATYPIAIKAITPLIDAGKIDEAKAKLQAAMNTLVVTTEVIPLPKLRAENLLKEAQTLAEKKDRSKDENDQLAAHLKSAREQLQIAELLGYGQQKDYKPMQEQIDGIEKASVGGRSGFGWFDKIKKQMADLVDAPRTRSWKIS